MPVKAPEHQLLWRVRTILLGLVAIVGLVIAIWSYVLEMTSGESVPYHTVFSDTEKLFANLASYVGVGLESLASFSERLERIPVAVGFDLVGLGLTTLRWAASVTATAVMDVEGKLFQPT